MLLSEDLSISVEHFQTVTSFCESRHTGVSEGIGECV